jgi:hypothetical protein
MFSSSKTNKQTSASSVSQRGRVSKRKTVKVEKEREEYEHTNNVEKVSINIETSPL